MPVVVAVFFAGFTLYSASAGAFSNLTQTIVFAFIALTALGLFGYFGPLKEFGLNQAQHMERLGDEIYEGKTQSFLSELAEISRSLQEVKIYLLFCSTMLLLITVSLLRLAFT